MAINSKAKGNRAELALCKILQDRFPGHHWSRAVGSGNRWSQVQGMSISATQTYTSDICTPDGFRWAIEVKCGYPEIDLGSLASNKLLDGFIAQATADAARSSRMPLLAFKQARKPWVALTPTEELPETFLINLDHGIGYKAWLAVNLEALLSIEDHFFWFDYTP